MHLNSIKKIGIVFGGGGARCFAHLGILEVLQDAQVPVDYILGSSMGSLVGALVANHVPIPIIKKTFYRWTTRMKWFIPNGMFTFSQKAVRDILDELLTVSAIEALNTRAAFMVTNLNTGKEMIMDSGNILRAVCASCSHPMVNKPLKFENSYLSDGGILDSVPADVCRRVMGDENVVITCSLETPLNPRFHSVNKLNTMFRSIYIPLLQSRQRIIQEHSDVILEPMKDIPFDFSHWRQIMNFDSIDILEDAYQRGRTEAFAKLPEIRTMIA